MLGIEYLLLVYIMLCRWLVHLAFQLHSGLSSREDVIDQVDCVRIRNDTGIDGIATFVWIRCKI